MNLARIPQGQERDYVWGMFRFLYKDGRLTKIFMSGVFFVIVIAMWHVVIQGIGRIIGEGALNLIIPVIIMALLTTAFSIIAVMNVIGARKMATGKAFDNIRVWDVQIVDGKYTRGKRVKYFATVMFTDGTCSSSQFEAEFYKSQKYKQGLVIAAYKVIIK